MKGNREQKGGGRYFARVVLGRLGAFAGVVAALVLVLYPRSHHAPFRIFVPKWTPLAVVCQGSTLPVEDEAARALIVDFIRSLQYDDLLDLYPSLGTGAGRVAQLGQEHYDTYFVAGDGQDAYAIALIHQERPQAKAWRVRQGKAGAAEVLWQDFYRTGDEALLGELLALQQRVEQEGLSAVAPPPGG